MLAVAARAAADLTGIQVNTAALFYHKICIVIFGRLKHWNWQTRLSRMTVVSVACARETEKQPVIHRVNPTQEYS